MKNVDRLAALFVTVGTCLPAAHASPPPELCKALRAFIESIKPDEKREFTFHTSWGQNFKDAPEPAIFAKRCEHGDYEPAKKVCDYLMKNGSAEFADANVKNAVSCLSSKTRFDPLMQVSKGAFSFSYGSNNRGALIDVTLQTDDKLGGMAFQLVADGY